MERLDYDRIERFWRSADGAGETQQSARWGMPSAFIPYRARLEEGQLRGILAKIPDRGLAVDLGCGTGLWSAFLVSGKPRSVRLLARLSDQAARTLFCDLERLMGRRGNRGARR